MGGNITDLSILSQIDGVEVELQKDLTKFSTMRLQAVGDLLTVTSVEGLSNLQKKLNELKIKPQILGWGANQILPKTNSVPYLHLEFPFDKSYLDQVRDVYVLPASVSLAILSSHAVKNGLSGWEVFTGIPASLGGAAFMNAGTNLGEIGSIIKSVKLMTITGDIRSVAIDDSSFSYRKNHFVSAGDVIFEVELVHKGVDPAISDKIKNYLDLRNRTQPLKEYTCGCMFKNFHSDSSTCRAGLFLDILGMKGFTVNGIRVSPLHANFMENFEGANHEDVETIVKLVQEELKLQFGIEFETEVKMPTT